eukprot:TRINITY_DN4998_c2_g1_i1.p1 TRINITY_DN4998_c2_g1~~TRINITY_DN4998_c2_g1_i1.p1  ORF type:complete len:411 (+),score=109.80 TRINITY_DN4998_c2_g1_i1:127-1359(+)
MFNNSNVKKLLLLSALIGSCSIGYMYYDNHRLFNQPNQEIIMKEDIHLNHSREDYGVSAMQGRRDYMEDMYDVKIITNKTDDLIKKNNKSYISSLYGVYDGHGGDRSSIYLKEKLLNDLEECMLTDKYFKDTKLSHKIPKCLDSTYIKVDKELEDLYRATDDRRFPGSTCTVAVVYYNHPDDVDETNGTNIDSKIISQVHHTPKEYGKGECGKFIDPENIAVGTKGMNIMVANTGDSRTIIGNVGDDGEVVAIPMSFDHKPEIKKESERIYSNGGFVRFKGCYRVNGGLAMSRAFGDFHYKTSGVIVTPDIKNICIEDSNVVLINNQAYYTATMGDKITNYQARYGKFKYLILASDGLFEAFTNEEVIRLAHYYRTKENKTSQEVSELLTQKAYENKSYDNITTLVVYLN